MNETPINLDGVPIFSSLSEEERKALIGLATPRQVEQGEILYAEGDPGDTMFVLLDGGIELQTTLPGGPCQTVLTVRKGSAFGLVEVVDPQPRGIAAKALETSELLELSRSAIDQYVKTHPEFGVNIAVAFAVGLAHQMRIAMDLLRQNLSWTLDVSGAAKLNLPQLIVNAATVQLNLTNGQQLEGTLLKVEPGGDGYQIFIRGTDQQVHLIPYHALVSLSFHSEDIDTSEGIPLDQ